MWGEWPLVGHESHAFSDQASVYKVSSQENTRVKFLQAKFFMNSDPASHSTSCPYLLEKALVVPALAREDKIAVWITKNFTNIVQTFSK